MTKRKWSENRYYRDGYRPMWGHHLNMLADLAESEAAGYPWVELDLRKKWQRIFLNEDWLTISIDEYTGKVAYKITLRGKRLLEVFARKLRNDGICPVCGERPRQRYASGRLGAYCTPCDSAARWNTTTDEPCSKCKQRPRHKSKSGVQLDYCEPCGRAAGRQKHARLRVNRRERINRGEQIMCSACGEKPVHVTERSVYYYCIECKRERDAVYQQRKERNRKLRRLRRLMRGSDAAD